MGNSPRKKSQKLSLLPGQGLRGPAQQDYNHHFGPETVGHLPFFPLQTRWFLFVCLFPGIKFLPHHFLLDMMGRAGQRAYFSSSKFLTPWRKFGPDEESYLSPEILELELEAVTGWDFWLSPLTRCMGVFLSVGIQVQIDIWEGGRAWWSLTKFCALFPEHISRLHSQPALQLRVATWLVQTKGKWAEIMRTTPPPRLLTSECSPRNVLFPSILAGSKH